MHPQGRFLNATILAAQPTTSQNGAFQVAITAKTEHGTATAFWLLGGERGDQAVEITMRNLALAGLPDEDLNRLPELIGKVVPIDVKHTEYNGKTYLNISIVDPNYVPNIRQVDPIEWKKLAARFKGEKKPDVKRDGTDQGPGF